MDRGFFIKILQAAAITLALAAVCQELEKPREERKWNGRLAGIIPYDFRMPNIVRIKEAYWNTDDSSIFTPRVCGIGWAVNFYALLEKLGLMALDVSEEGYLMPTKSIKEVWENIPAAE